MATTETAHSRAREALLRRAKHLDLIPPSASLTSERAAVRRLGNAAFAVRLLIGIRRPRWLLHPGRLPAARVTRRDAHPPDETSVAIADRLIAAFARVVDESPTTDMWAWISEHRQRALARALSESRSEAVAQMLERMFREDFVLGMAQGPIVNRANSAVEDQVWKVKTLDSLVSLAEALGVSPVENPEQGGTGLALSGGLEGLSAGIEDGLGFRLDFPDVGAPSGLVIGGRLVTPSTPDQVYAAVRLDEAITLNLGPDTPVRVTEIGGGYGALCYWFLQRRPKIDAYTIVDLPLVNAIQGFFLARVLGPDRVSFYGEPAALVSILPTTAMEDVRTPFSALVNKDSMPEMPQEAMEGYLIWARENCDGIFYSYNQEAAASFLGKAQGVVPEAASRVGGFRRVRREPAWVRPGYVEEVYRLSATASADERGERPQASQAKPRLTNGPPSA